MAKPSVSVWERVDSAHPEHEPFNCMTLQSVQVSRNVQAHRSLRFLFHASLSKPRARVSGGCHICISDIAHVDCRVIGFCDTLPSTIG